jgi:signal peptidase II
MKLQNVVNHQLVQSAKILNWRLLMPSILFIVALDQLTKLYFNETLFYNSREIVIEDILYLTLHYNKGIAFGLRIFENQTLFVIATIVTIIVIFFYLLNLGLISKLQHVVIAFIMGGAIGNLIDRAFYGRVVDFIEVNIPDIPLPLIEIFGNSFGGYTMETFPIFNVADMAVSTGMIILIISFFFPKMYLSDDES